MRFCIWSHEHRMWWRAERQGYTANVNEAGFYSESEAADITLTHIPPGEEVAVEERVALSHGSGLIWGMELHDRDNQ